MTKYYFSRICSVYWS